MSGADKRLTIMFAMLHPGYLRNFDSLVRCLLDRGHTVHLVFSRADRLGESPILAELSARPDGFAYSWYPHAGAWRWATLTRHLRLSMDYLRYFDPRYSEASKLRERVERRMLAPLRVLPRVPGLRTVKGRRLLDRGLRAVERVVPTNPALQELIERVGPDVVLVTPLVDLGSDQDEFVKAAAAVGIPTCLCVCSWDNLTNKGLIRRVPDLVCVWNESQKDEAVDLHGVSSERVVVTGAHCYDHWFGWQPSRSREDFARMVALPAGRPIVLYLGSSPFIAPDEVDFVRRWLDALRTSDEEVLRGVGVLIRPHPQNAAQWEGADFSSYGDVAVWPRGGSNPVDLEAKTAYFDSLYHSAAVIGVNTSAQIEAGIIGRPVHAILDPQFRETQEGTLHFHHLVEVNGGLLHVAGDLPAHLSQLAQSVAGAAEASVRSRRFVEAFVRPRGIETPATPIAADAVEAVVRSGGSVEPPRAIRGSKVLAALLFPIAVLMDWRARAAKRRRRKAKHERALEKHVRTESKALRAPTDRLETDDAESERSLAMSSSVPAKGERPKRR